jgi:hypothetical protein
MKGELMFSLEANMKFHLVIQRLLWIAALIYWLAR